MGEGVRMYCIDTEALVFKKGNSAVKIDGRGGQEVYLYNVKIGNFPEILMSSLIPHEYL